MIKFINIRLLFFAIFVLLLARQDSTSCHSGWAHAFKCKDQFNFQRSKHSKRTKGNRTIAQKHNNIFGQISIQLSIQRLCETTPRIGHPSLRVLIGRPIMLRMSQHNNQSQQQQPTFSQHFFFYFSTKLFLLLFSFNSNQLNGLN